MPKSAGFTADIVLPAHTCEAKILKKLKKALPLGSVVSITTTDRSLQSINNLCDTCINEFATCNPEDVLFGNGVGNDNVIECKSFNKR